MVGPTPTELKVSKLLRICDHWWGWHSFLKYQNRRGPPSTSSISRWAQLIVYIRSSPSIPYPWSSKRRKMKGEDGISYIVTEGWDGRGRRSRRRLRGWDMHHRSFLHLPRSWTPREKTSSACPAHPRRILDPRPLLLLEHRKRRCTQRYPAASSRAPVQIPRHSPLPKKKTKPF